MPFKEYHLLSVYSTKIMLQMRVSLLQPSFTNEDVGIHQVPERTSAS